MAVVRSILGDALEALRTVWSARTSLVPIFLVVSTLGIALVLSRQLGLSRMELDGIDEMSVQALRGKPTELVHRLAWGASALVLLGIALGAIVHSLLALVQLGATRKDLACRGTLSITGGLGLLVFFALFRFLTHLGPSTLSGFQTEMARSHLLAGRLEGGVDIGQMTFVGNALMGITIAILVATVTFLLAAPAHETVHQFRVRYRSLRRVVAHAMVLLVCGLVEISLLHSWPAAVMQDAEAARARTLALVVSLVGGAFFGLFALAVSVPSAMILDHQREVLGRRILGAWRSPEDCRQWMRANGLVPTPLDKRLQVLASLTPVLTAAPLTALVQYLAQGVGK